MAAKRLYGLLLVASVVTAGCSSESPAASPSDAPVATNATPAVAAAPAATAQSAAESIKAAVPDVRELVVLTEDNDANNLIGRPNGYEAATVLIDTRTECSMTEPGVDCGATVEQWPNQAAAQRRADYIQTILQSSTALGSEWNTVQGNLLLRVSGKLKPTEARQYEAAFSG